MADELAFYTHPMPRGRIVRWMLEEVGQPYPHRAARFRHEHEGAGPSRHQSGG